MNITLTKTHKLLVTCGLVLALGANVGTFLLLPERIAKLEAAHVKDHDVLVEVKIKIDVLNQRLVNINKNENYNNLALLTNYPIHKPNVY